MMSKRADISGIRAAEAALDKLEASIEGATTYTWTAGYHCIECGWSTDKIGGPLLPCPRCYPQMATVPDMTPMPQPIVMQGWQCPLCKTVHAPWAKACTCSTPMYVRSDGT